MSKITHPSMGRVRDTSASSPAPQSYVVEDETGVSEPIVEKSTNHGMGAPKIVEPVRASGDRSVLESLIFLGSSSREVEIDQYKFKITTLTHRENNQLMKELYKFGDGADLFTLRSLTLALVLRTVNNVPLEDLPVPDEEVYTTPFEKKLAIVDSMQMNVVTRLYNEYNELLKVVDTQVDGKEIKKS